MPKTSELPNIGKEMESLLAQIGINTAEDLKSLGTEQTFIQLQAICEDACFSKLMAIEGAIEGIRWHNVDRSRKEALKEFFNQIKQSQKLGTQKTIPASRQK